MRSLLAVCCPPLAVLASGTRSQVAANAGLTLLFFVPGVVHALSVVKRHTVRRRYETLYRAMDRCAA